MENILNGDPGEQPEAIVPDAAETIATESPSRTENSEAEEAAQQEADAAEQATAEAAAQAAAPEQPKPKAPLDWKERRRIEEMNKRRAAEARTAEVEAELERLKTTAQADPAQQPASAPLSPEQARAAARAEIEAENRARSFSEATGRVLQAGMANISDFEDARREMVQNFGDHLVSRNDFFEALTDLEPDDVPADQIEAHRAQVFYALARDPEQTERILSMSPLKMAMAVTKLSNKLAKPVAALAPAPKPISKAPPPVTPLNGAPQSSSRLDDENMPMDQWAKIYLKEMASKGR